MKNNVIIYTDGGCDPNPGVGGWAAVLIFDDHQQEFSGGEVDSTNNRMELTAAIMALESLPEPYEVELYTDSEYLKNGITQWIKNWVKKNWRGVKNPDLWQRLHDATQRHRITWRWVKGHAGNKFNERVDQMAMAEIAKQRRVGKAAPTDSKQTALKTVVAYLNGICKGTKGGWGVIIVENGSKKELSGSASPATENRIKLVAAIEALETLAAPCEIELHTDSEYLERGVLFWINGWLKNGWQTAAGEPVKNQDLWQQLHKLKNKHKIRFVRENSQSEFSERLAQLAMAEIDNHSWG